MVMLPSLREAVRSNRYTAAEKHAAAAYCVRRLSEHLWRALAAGDEARADNYRQARDLARRIEAEWRER